MYQDLGLLQLTSFHTKHHEKAKVQYVISDQ